MSLTDPVVVTCLFLIAALYSSVGHGGASGYLALMAMVSLAKPQAAVMALVLNVVVALIALVSFERARHFDWKLAWPFLCGSVPMAFFGGAIKLTDRVYGWILAVALVAAAVRLLWEAKPKSGVEEHRPPFWTAAATGAVIGFVSGLIGIGGGVFLSPIVIFAGWAGAKKASATSAMFILANSLAGLAAKPSSDWGFVWSNSVLLAAGVLGALVGSTLGARVLPAVWVRRTLSLVLLVAVSKLVMVT